METINKYLNMTNSFDFQSVVEKANAIPVASISPEIAKDTISVEQCAEFIKTVANTHGLTDAQAFVAITLLVLKGACNSAAPKQMSVDISVDDGATVNITKYDIEYACHLVTGNTFLRRFAQAMAPQISHYAELNNLNGDLAIRLNNLALAKGGPPLNSKEKAWASSFCQNLPDLASHTGDRLPTLLAEDFQKRFGGKKDKKKTGPSGKELTPREWRRSNPQKVNQKQEKANSETEQKGQQASVPETTKAESTKASSKAAARSKSAAKKEKK